MPPGNPTVEVEMIGAAPPRVSVHFTRMVAHGEAGSHQGLEERIRTQIAHLEEPARLLAMVKPRAIAMAHAGMSAVLGTQGEAELAARMEKAHGVPFVTAFGAVLAALEHFGARRVALGTPYDAATTARTKAHLEANGIEVVSVARLENVENIYLETAARARELARKVDVPQADAVFLSGLGMPTLDELEAAERELGKPVVSGAAAMLWKVLRAAGEPTPLKGLGRLLANG